MPILYHNITVDGTEILKMMCCTCKYWYECMAWVGQDKLRINAFGTFNDTTPTKYMYFYWYKFCSKDDFLIKLCSIDLRSSLTSASLCFSINSSGVDAHGGSTTSLTLNLSCRIPRSNPVNKQVTNKCKREISIQINRQTDRQTDVYH